MAPACAPPVAKALALLLATPARSPPRLSLHGELVWLYWQVGRRLREDVVGEGRAAYGEQVVSEVAAALTAEIGRGLGRRGLCRMMRFAELFPLRRVGRRLTPGVERAPDPQAEAAQQSSANRRQSGTGAKTPGRP